jgi:hypothetical protein
MSELTSENWMGIIAISSIFMWGIAILLFGRISVKHIEREMKKEGIKPPVWDKGIGSIIVTYSLIMVFPKLNPTIVNFEAVRRYTRKEDRRLAFFLQISSTIFFTVMFTVAYLYSPES